MKRIPRRIFTAEFKLEAIKLVTQHGLKQAEAATYAAQFYSTLQQMAA